MGSDYKGHGCWFDFHSRGMNNLILLALVRYSTVLRIAIHTHCLQIERKVETGLLLRSHRLSCSMKEITSCYLKISLAFNNFQGYFFVIKNKRLNKTFTRVEINIKILNIL